MVAVLVTDALRGLYTCFGLSHVFTDVEIERAEGLRANDRGAAIRGEARR